MGLYSFIGVAVTWLGIVLAYDSFTWPPSHDGWPVSFFVVALTLAGYVLAQLVPHRKTAGREPAVASPDHRQPAELGRDLAAEFRIGR